MVCMDYESFSDLEEQPPIKDQRKTCALCASCHPKLTFSCGGIKRLQFGEKRPSAAGDITNAANTENTLPDADPAQPKSDPDDYSDPKSIPDTNNSIAVL